MALERKGGKSSKTFSPFPKFAKNVNNLKILRKINTNIPVDRLQIPVIQSVYYFS